ncbi:MAG: MerR family transcriptional regulator [Solirubrobacteraceae bacterium]
MDPRGAYAVDRAAALSGVPKATIYYWARRDILVPSVSRQRVRLWSYSDLLGLRTIAWLRATKTSPDGYDVPATTMRVVRRALRELRGLELELWTEERSPNVGVDRRGQIVLDPSGLARRVDGQQLLDAEMLDVLRPFEMGSAQGGPDLVAPRLRLRIVSGKLAGAPHVYRTRIETQALAALRWRGLAAGKIVGLYPVLEPADVDEALDLERQLQPALALAA